MYKFTTSYVYGTRCTRANWTGDFCKPWESTHASPGPVPAAARPAGIAFIGARETPQDWSIYILSRESSVTSAPVELYTTPSTHAERVSEWASIQQKTHGDEFYVFKELTLPWHHRNARHVFLEPLTRITGQKEDGNSLFLSLNPLRQTVECVIKMFARLSLNLVIYCSR